MKLFTINAGNPAMGLPVVKPGIDLRLFDFGTSKQVATIVGFNGHDNNPDSSSRYLLAETIDKIETHDVTYDIYDAVYVRSGYSMSDAKIEPFKLIETVSDENDEEIMCRINLFVDGYMPISQGNLSGGVVAYESIQYGLFDGQYPVYDTFPGKIIAEGLALKGPDYDLFKSERKIGAGSKIAIIPKNRIFRVFHFRPGSLRGSFDYLFKWDGRDIKFQPTREFELSPLI